MQHALSRYPLQSIEKTQKAMKFGLFQRGVINLRYFDFCSGKRLKTGLKVTFFISLKLNSLLKDSRRSEEFSKIPQNPRSFGWYHFLSQNSEMLLSEHFHVLSETRIPRLEKCDCSL